MLAIRMQRTGRKGHAMFRVIVQDSRLTPTSGKVVARLGNFDPHSKALTLDKEKATFYLDHGAQPSERVARLLKSEGVKLPDWVKLPAAKERPIRNADKRRSTRPDEPAAPEAPAESAEPEAAADAEPAEAAPSEESPAEEQPADEKPETTEEAEAPEPEAEPEPESEPETTESDEKTD